MNAVTESVTPPPATSEAPRLLDHLRAKNPAAIRHVGQSAAKDVRAAVETYFDQHKPSLEAVAPRAFAVRRLVKIALNAIRQQPKLQECSVASLFAGVLLCAQMGLEPNTGDGHVWLIPRERNQPKRDANGAIVKDGADKWVWEKIWEVTVQLGYKGRIELAYRSPKIALVKAVLVHEGDEIDILEGTAQTIHHRPAMSGFGGGVVGAYALARLTTGATLFEWMTRAQIDEIRDGNSDAYNGAVSKAAAISAEASAKNDKARSKALATPWIDDYGQMARKTVINRIWNYLPKTAEMTMAGVVDGAAVPDAVHHETALEGVAYTETSDDAGDGDRGAAGSGPTTSESASAGAAESGDAQEDGDPRPEPPLDQDAGADGAPRQIEHERTVPFDLGTKREPERVAAGQTDAPTARPADPPHDPPRAPGAPPRRGAPLRRANRGDPAPTLPIGGFGSVE